VPRLRIVSGQTLTVSPKPGPPEEAGASTKGLIRRGTCVWDRLSPNTVAQERRRWLRPQVRGDGHDRQGGKHSSRGWPAPDPRLARFAAMVAAPAGPPTVAVVSGGKIRPSLLAEKLLRAAERARRPDDSGTRARPERAVPDAGPPKSSRCTVRDNWRVGWREEERKAGRPAGQAWEAKHGSEDHRVSATTTQARRRGTQTRAAGLRQTTRGLGALRRTVHKIR